MEVFAYFAGRILLSAYQRLHGFRGDFMCESVDHELESV